MSATADQLLGVGIYTVAEAAMYARAHTQTMSRWLYGDKKGESTITPQLAATGERWVTFLDFIQALHIKQIRTDTEYRIPLSKIREAINTAKQHYGVDYPLAREHTTFLYGKELAIKLGDEQYVQVSGKEKKHPMIAQIVRIYAKDLTYDKSGLANSLKIWTYGQFDILMNPAIRFGEPLLPSCGYSTRTLWEAARAEGSIEAAAEMYGVTTDEVEAGYRYWESLPIHKAA